jgi:hypothetical protein
MLDFQQEYNVEVQYTNYVDMDLRYHGEKVGPIWSLNDCSL